MSYTITQETLYKSLGEIVNRIESCGASPELTHAVSFASDLQRAIGNEYNSADPYSLCRVIDTLNRDSNVRHN